MKTENTHNGIEIARRESTAFDGYEFWSVEGKPVSIHLRSSVAGQIRAMSDIPPVAGLPVESGGILWGRVRDVGEDYYIVSVEQADRVACDHNRGEGWVLSVKDRRELGKQLKRQNGDLQPVGFWRSHRRLGLYLDKRDFSFMQEFFANPWSVALCVRPPSTAGFFIWENGDVRRTSSYREFQLPDTGQLAVVPAPPASVTSWKWNKDWNWSQDWNPDWKKWAAVASLVVALILAAFFLRPTNSSSAFNVLSMKAQTKPGAVRLSWDPRSKLLQGAERVILWIADGPDESKLELSAGQVRAGSIEYAPSTPNVNFRMQVGDFTESLSVDVAPSQTAAPLATAVAPYATLPVESIDPGGAVESQRARKSSRISANRKLAMPPPAPKRRSVPAPSLEVLPPPEIALGVTKFDRPNLPPRASEIPQVSATLEKPGSSPIKKAFGWMIPGRKKDFVPAKAVSEVRPHLTAPEPISVSVRIEIDEKGLVRDADLITKKVDSQLARSAVEAAKRWRFEPARQDDRPVASSMVVKFRFGDEQNP